MMVNLPSFTQRSPDRIRLQHQFWHGKGKPFIMACVMACVMLELLFLANMCYLYGSVYQQSSRVHNFKILMVDFDGGVIGRALSGAYQQLHAHTFPEVVPHSVSDYSTVADVRNAVCKGHYWGAVYTHSDASNRLSAALAGGQAATAYDAADTITYIYNGVRYPAFTSGYLQSNLAELVAVSGVVYNHINGTQAAHAVNMSDTAAVQALLNPIQASAAPIQPTTHGARVFYNTVSMVMPILMQFFFCMAINGISTSFQLLGKLPRLENYVIRILVSIMYTLVGSLLMAAYIWAFRENWAVTGSDFAVTWMALWLYMHINFYFFDFATAFVPMQFVPFVVLTWVIINVAGSVSPFELMPGFFHLSYALPSAETYALLVQIWSEGCYDRDYRAVPILFSWWIVGTVASVFAVRHRCKKALENEEKGTSIKGDEEKDGRPETGDTAVAV